MVSASNVKGRYSPIFVRMKRSFLSYSRALKQFPYKLESNFGWNKRTFLVSHYCIKPAVERGGDFLMIDKTLGHYEITSQLGKGGMGEVYQADIFAFGSCFLRC